MDTFKGLPLADGANGVYDPGERSVGVAGLRAAQGLLVAPKVWREPTESAAKLGITPPETTPDA
ncbi:hypothetical protein [Streptomyces shenzhenensis]|uniref:hypothetical protein n=1 Tax=Streptomyces shenzhenensis TaxID=943815 RepID=UPI0015F03C3A|nr:hypothetical protein [Streptomyces shenzhenensis]